MALLFALAACSGNPLNNGGPDGGGGGGGGGGGSTAEIPEALRRDVTAATYNAAAETLTVNMDQLDASPISGTFTRDAAARALDVPGYQAYTFQEASTHRSFIGLFRKSGNVIAGAVGDGGQFANTVVGGIYARDGAYTRPTSGLATYTGTYAGVLNTGLGASGPLDAVAPLRTQGTVQVNADFTNDRLNGGVINRSIVDTATPLRDVFLQITDIAEDGTFAGTVQQFSSSSLNDVGEYGGIFGGRNANDVAAVLVFQPDPDIAALVEQGAFAISCVDTFSPPNPNPTGVPCAN